MKPLTKAEIAVMNILWGHEKALSVYEIIAEYPDPKPAYSTVSTFLKILEAKGYVAHEAFGNTHRYYAAVSESEHGKRTLGNVVNRYFGSSYVNAVSSLVQEEKISLDELKSLIELVEKQNK